MRTLKLGLDIRTAAAILMSAGIFVALAASGESSTSSKKGNAPTRNETSHPKASNSKASNSKPSNSKASNSKPSKSNGEHNKPSEPRYTVSQQNAIKAAESYLAVAGFSKAGLIEQLSSRAGSGFPHQDAVFAVDHLHVNWDKQAVRSAKEYLNTSSFSCHGLIEQLSSSAGSHYTVAQAEYATKKVGLC